MRYFTQLRNLLAALSVLAIAACADVPSAPIVAESADAALARGSEAGRPSASDSGVVRFTIDPMRPLEVMMGHHRINLPANVICEPFVSGYGPAYWDAPCEIATRKIPMMAFWYSNGDLAHVRFEPDLRFAPSADQSKWATLTMRVARGEVTDQTAILWWSRTENRWIDEAALDPSLAVWVDRSGNRVTRRLKHFSGYVIFTFCGDGCEPPPPPPGEY